MTTKSNLSDALKKLADIVRWFDEQKEVDVEVGLEKVKEGAGLIKNSRERLKEIENEFEEVQKQISSDAK
ncbi:MAG: exodeoxyribonuclease VII small subunit [Patescibacteria group bacterium]